MAKYIFVGLGNPGREYESTRHNIGFMTISAFGVQLKANWSNRPPLADISEVSYARTPIVLVKPLTYMNLSGRTVKTLSDKFSVSPENIVVIVDEYNFDVGRIQLKARGSDGGHNGLASIIECLGTDNFWRLRMGIGRDFALGGMADYVLSVFAEREISARDRMIVNAVEALKLVVKHGPLAAMNSINRASANADGL